MRLDVVLFACADAIKTSEGLQSGEHTLDTCGQVSMHPFFDRLENVGLLDAAHLNTVLRELFLWEELQSVVRTVDLEVTSPWVRRYPRTLRLYAVVELFRPSDLLDSIPLIRLLI
ncbi:hypothetical protein C484_18042 [Natrialba taiwanensis DSM 12281]|uniref:Uncharacterized protein n=1 Tax=Natrialba taiwanensis DSM 12281 TaxID=1230458 RepID=L9ZLT5_9EURY|nr:hypothetical protein C484_18042 [Natrialba taiwanensis DSM 12281]